MRLLEGVSLGAVGSDRVSGVAQQGGWPWNVSPAESALIGVATDRRTWLVGWPQLAHIEQCQSTWHQADA